MDAAYWEQRYESGQTGWDIGEPSVPLKEYFDHLTDVNLKILIPGCGNAYEARYLFNKGFKQVYLLDFAHQPLAEFQKANPSFPKEQLIREDFFTHQGSYDLIIEQTFFCALDPVLRPAYAPKMKTLLRPSGKIAGLLFNCIFEKEGPPFGGTEKEYRQYFEDNFIIHTMAPCYNSIPPRAGKELFFELLQL